VDSPEFEAGMNWRERPDSIVDWSVLVEHRFGIQAGLDAAAWFFALAVATILRHEFHVETIPRIQLLVISATAAAVQLAVGAATGLYRGRFRFGSLDEVAVLVRSVAVATGVIAVINAVVLVRYVPLSATLGGGFIALVAMGGARYGWRLALERRLRPGDDAVPVVVFGAGEGGLQVLTAMLRNPESPYRPVALLDDNLAKGNLTISGIQVEGTRADLPGVARRHGARAVVVAIPSASGALMAELSDLARAAELRVLVVPAVRELFDGSVDISDVRPLTESDLLGRHRIDTDVASIAGYLLGRRVLVTGAGGSIGSELVRQLRAYGPAELILVDRDESALHAIQLAVEGRALLDTPDLVVADIRDREAVDELMRERRPDVVFHAAALKHLTLLERHPTEAVRNNVLGTHHLLEAAIANGVQRFVNVSTDKAAAPTSVLGYSKAVAERLTAEASGRASGVYLSVRFGNVLGSRGSVLTAFRAQIDAGGPVTVTHPDVTRYFMTTEEAAELVIQAGALGRDGEVLILDVGQPVRIADLAARLVAQADRDVEIVFTGLRPGEKLTETLWSPGEEPRQGPHPLISHVLVPPLPPSVIDDLVTTRDPVEVRRRLEALVAVPRS
jgi:FlaA1/EpsC-like NDP-sugar epimerase